MLARRWLRALAFLMMFGLLATACGSSDDDDGNAAATTEGSGGGGDTTGTSEAPQFDRQGTLTLGYSTGPGVMDPHQAPANSGPTTYLSPVFDTLVTVGEDDELAPRLATSWTASADGNSLDVKLRTDVTFHDGTPFNADAVVANFDYLRTTLAGTPNAAKIANVTGVEAVDESTVRFTVNDGTAAILPFKFFNYGVSAMVSPASLTDPAVMESGPVGSGPYEITSVTADRASYVRQPYWDADADARLPENLTVISYTDTNALLAALESGQIDASFINDDGVDVDSLTSGGDIELSSRPSNINFTIRLNLSSPKLQDPKVRKALQLAIDRQAITDNLYPDTRPEVQLWTDGEGAHLDDVDAADFYDPDQAKQLLQEAGASDLELDGIALETTVYQNVATAVQAQLADVGITFNFTAITPSQSQAEFARGNSDFLVTSISGSVDPGDILASFIYGENTPGGGDPQIADMAADAQKEPPGEARNEAFQEINRYMLDNPPVITISARPARYLYHDYVYGIENMLETRYTNHYDYRQLGVLPH